MSNKPPTKEYWGNKERHKDGVLHRDNDLLFLQEEIRNITNMENDIAITVLPL